METCPSIYVSLIVYITSEIRYHRNVAIFNQCKFLFYDVTIKAERGWWDFQNSIAKEEGMQEKSRDR